jgi:hypothetical protein
VTATPRPVTSTILGVRIGVYPGSFNPPTVAHLAVARAAFEQCRLERIELTISRDTLGKHRDDLGEIDDRLATLHRLTEQYPWLSAGVTDHRLIADIADGYDVVIVGADKWAQVIDPTWYGGSEAERNRALGRLPHVAVAPRPPDPVPAPATGVTILTIAEMFHPVSSTAVRQGRSDWLLRVDDPDVGRQPPGGLADDGMA